MNKRGAWLRGAGSTLLLIAGALAALASNITTSEDQHEDCCSCLARSRNDFGEPCIDMSTVQCVDMIAEGAPVPSSSACLREICVDDVCRGLCDFLAVHGPDAGVADGG